MSTIYDKIVNGDMKAWVVWESETHMAFLTPFANTPGHTVVIPKKNPGDYIFRVDDQSFRDIMLAAKTVAKLLENAFSTDRVGMLFHGLGVAHLHAQLIPCHANLDKDKDKAAAYRAAHPQFAHELTAADGPRMSDEELDAIQTRILEANK
jgi:histidine triad (HIT) family protein